MTVGSSDGTGYESMGHKIAHDIVHEPNVYVIRHGSTALNSEGSQDRIRGWSDVPLSPEGHKEAEETAEQLKDSGIQVLFHSDLSRAKDTAEAIRKVTGAKLVSTPKLRPWHVGTLTGTSSESAHPVLADHAKNKPHEPVPGGESFSEFKNRVFEGVQEAKEQAKGRVYGLVTHHRVERLLNAWSAEGMPDNKKLHMDTFTSKGEKPASYQRMKL